MGRASQGIRAGGTASQPRGNTSAPKRRTPHTGPTRFRSRRAFAAARPAGAWQFKQEDVSNDVEFGGWTDETGRACKLIWTGTGELVIIYLDTDGGDGDLEILGYVGSQQEAENLLAGHAEHAPELKWAKDRIFAYVRANEARWDTAAPVQVAPAQPAAEPERASEPVAADAAAPGRGFGALMGNRRGT